MLYNAFQRGDTSQNCPFTFGYLDPIEYMASWTHLNQYPNGISIGPAVFARLTTVKDRQSDRPTDWPLYLVCNNTYVVLRCGLKFIIIDPTSSSARQTARRLLNFESQTGINFRLNGYVSR